MEADFLHINKEFFKKLILFILTIETMKSFLQMWEKMGTYKMCDIDTTFAKVTRQ